MSILVTLISILLKSTLFIFLIAFICGMLARSAYNQGRFDRARLLGRGAFGASSLLAVLYLGMTMLSLGQSGMVWNMIFAALWGFLAWRDYQFLRQIGSRE